MLEACLSSAVQMDLKQECCLEVQINIFLTWLPVAVEFFSTKTFMKMPNGAEKKRQATDNRIRNVPLENIPGMNEGDYLEHHW